MEGIKATKAIIIDATLTILEFRVLVESDFFPFYCAKIKRLRAERMKRGMKIWMKWRYHYLNMGI